MPVRLGLATSHPVYLALPAEAWQSMYQRVVGQVPPPPEARAETLDDVRQHVQRIDAALEALRAQVEDQQIEALILVSDDQGEAFDPAAAMPTIALFVGEEATGADQLAHRLRGDPGEAEEVRLCGHPRLASFLAQGLLGREFDLATVRDLTERRAAGRGLGHGFVRIAPRLVPRLNIPIIPLFLNCYYPPLPSAERCLKLGRAIADVLEDWPERVAICGSGGLSHDPGGPRAGWIDEPLDHFVLDSLADGQSERLRGLFAVDSATLRGGTGEIRNWLVVAGAMGARKATLVDYIPAYHAVTGLGFAYWPPGPSPA